MKLACVLAVFGLAAATPYYKADQLTNPQGRHCSITCTLVAETDPDDSSLSRTVVHVNHDRASGHTHHLCYKHGCGPYSSVGCICNCDCSDDGVNFYGPGATVPSHVSSIVTGLADLTGDTRIPGQALYHAICPTGTYSQSGHASMGASVASVGADYTCTAHTVCGDGTDESVAPSNFVNRECQCKDGYHGLTGSATKTCTAHTVCGTGAQQLVAPSAIANRECECSEGYTNLGGTAATNTCSACAAGDYKGSLGNGACDTCHAGSITNTGANTGASTCTECGAGTFSLASDVPSCTTCNAGSITNTLSNTGASTCTACSDGTYSAASTVACAPMTSCDLGQAPKIPLNGVAGSDLSTTTSYTALPDGQTADHAGCGDCASGFYSDQTDLTTCSTHAGCPIGKGKASAIGDEASVDCVDCADPTYSSSDSTSICHGTSAAEIVWASASSVQCAPGYTAPDGIDYDASGTYLSGCIACAANHYKTDAGNGACTAHTTCGTGAEESVAPNDAKTSNRECQCKAGYHTLGGTAATNTCNANQCNCANGVAVADADCTAHGATQCSSCTGNFHGATCTANQCNCANGVAVADAGCTAHGATQCSSCSNGNYCGATCTFSAYVDAAGGSCSNTCGTGTFPQTNSCGSTSTRSCYDDTCGCTGTDGAWLGNKYVAYKGTSSWPDLPGKQYWCNDLNGGATRDEVEVNIMIAVGTLLDGCPTGTIKNLYASLLCKWPDLGGMKYHCSRYHAGHSNAADIAWHADNGASEC